MSARPQPQLVSPSLIPTLSSSLTQNSPGQDPLHPSSKAKLLLQTTPDFQDARGVGGGGGGGSYVRYTGIARNTDDGGPWAGILSTLEALLPPKQPHLIPLVSHTTATILCLCRAKEKAGEVCAEITPPARGETWFKKKKKEVVI